MGRGFSPGMGRDLALDLGTSQTRLAARGRGLLLEEPTVAAVDRQTGQVLHVGQTALEMLGRTPDRLLALRPISRSALTDLTVTAALLRAFLKKAPGGRLAKPRLLLAVPTGITQVEERALVEAGLRAGAGKVCLMEAPLAAALGAGLDPAGTRGALVVDIGAGTTDSGVVTLGGLAAWGCTPVAGDALDRALVRFVRQTHGLLLGQRTAEAVKQAIGRVGDAPESPALEVKGRCLTTGLPRSVTLTADETARAFAPAAEEILLSVREVLERTPPELAADVARSGLLLTGRGSLLRGLDRLLSQALDLPVTLAESPGTTTILGLEASLPSLRKLRDGPRNFARRRQTGRGPAQ